MKNTAGILNYIVPQEYYEVKKHNIVGLFFVIIVIMVAQYPGTFRSVFNTVLGKLIVLVFVVLLTNYNIVAGLTATIVTLALYIDLFKTGNEGFVGKTDSNITTPKADTAISGKPTTSTPALVGSADMKHTLVTNKFAAPAPVVTKPSVKTLTVPVEKQANIVDLKLNDQQQVASKNSKAIPYTPGKNSKVEAFSGMYGGYSFATNTSE